MRSQAFRRVAGRLLRRKLRDQSKIKEVYRRQNLEETMLTD